MTAFPRAPGAAALSRVQPVREEATASISLTEADALPSRICSWSDYTAFLRADLTAHGLTRWGVLSALRHPVVRYQRLMRRIEYLQTRRGAVSRVARAWTRYRLLRVGLLTGLTVPPGVCGPGFSVAHHGTIVINTRTRIGRFCRMHPPTTIGVAHGGVPTIGDHVYIGPGAVVYGGITVGDRAVIGANAVVGRDVPPGVTVAGAPARVVSDRGSQAMMPAYFPGVDGPDGRR